MKNEFLKLAKSIVVIDPPDQLRLRKWRVELQTEIPVSPAERIPSDGNLSRDI